MGFAIRVEGGRLTADLEDVFPDFEVAFEGNEDGSTFYRSARTRALNEEYGDMLHKILDLEACAPALPCCTPRMCRSRCGCCKQMQHAGCIAMDCRFQTARDAHMRILYDC